MTFPVSWVAGVAGGVLAHRLETAVLRQIASGTSAGREVLSWVLGSNSNLDRLVLGDNVGAKVGEPGVRCRKAVTILIGPVINGSVLRPSCPSSGTSIASERSSGVGLTGTVPTLPASTSTSIAWTHRRCCLRVINRVFGRSVST